MKKLAMFAILLVLGAATHAADMTPVQLALWNKLQIFPETTEVWGLRLDLLYGKNANMYGADLGLVNNTADMIGVEAGAVNWNRGDVLGIQAGALFNANEGSSRIVGIQVAPVFNYASSHHAEVYGLQLAVGLNYMPDADVYGLQAAFWNGLRQNVYGAELGGMLNNTRDMYGLEAALVNFSRGDSYGAQLAGLLNINAGENSKVGGVQVAGLVNYAPNAQVVGVQLSPFGNIVSDGSLEGLQISCWNTAKKMTGVQLGVVNLSNITNGAQIGVFNKSDRMSGFQLGLINVINTSPLTGFPLFNVQF